jgi:hypothetical protein
MTLEIDGTIIAKAGRRQSGWWEAWHCAGGFRSER